MSVFRVEKTRSYTVMSNHHLRNKSLSLKAKGAVADVEFTGRMGLHPKKHLNFRSIRTCIIKAA
jgi:hypothetical protein